MRIFLKTAFETQVDGNHQSDKHEYQGVEIMASVGAVVLGKNDVRYIIPFENIAAMEEPTQEEMYPNGPDGIPPIHLD